MIHLALPLALSVGLFAVDDPAWPPTGPEWSTDPSAALDQARRERKAVFVYIATKD